MWQIFLSLALIIKVLLFFNILQNKTTLIMKKLYLLFILFTTIANAQEPFITTWEVENSDLTINAPIFGTDNNYTVDFGDGTILSNQTESVSHTYASPGIYTISFSGDFNRIEFVTDFYNILTVEQWGDVQWSSMKRAFMNCGFLNINATDTPDLSQVTDMSEMFRGCSSLNQSLNNWDVSNVTDMHMLFYNADEFNQPLNNWDVSNVTNMYGMFMGCSDFNQSLNNWDVSNVTDMHMLFFNANIFNQLLNNWNVSNVTDMSEMFRYTTAFNQNLNDWDVSNVTNMSSMFYAATAFDQPLNNWNVSNVTNMESMFAITPVFNQTLDNWDVSNVTDMSKMFFSAYTFNQPLNNWDVSNVTNMENMFFEAFAFNQPLNSWDMSNVINTGGMFFEATSFNQPLNNWDVSNVTIMASMFYMAESFNESITNWNVSNVTNMGSMLAKAASFNQPLNDWNVNNVTNMSSMFKEASNFNQDISAWNFNPEVIFSQFLYLSNLDVDNYDKLLLRFAQLELQDKLISVYPLKYCDYGVQEYLVNNLGWTILGDSLGEECIGNNISGNVIYDENTNGCDTEDPGIGNFLVTADNGEFTYSTISSNGAYDLSVMEGTYTVELLNVPDYYTVTPPSSNVDFTGFGNEEELNFCLTANETISDLNITLLSIDEARPGFESNYQLVVQNIGTQTITNVSANLIYNETIQSFMDSSQAPATTTANQLTFDLATLLPFESKVIDITMETFTPPTINGGETINFITSVTPDTGDYTPNDNTYNLEQLVVNSYDPNDKRVMQGEEIYIEDTGEYLDYVIRFQNTGTASAITVRIEDLLHPNLDWTTFTPVTASHDYRIEITDGNQVEFIFDNINLPHEAADEAGSNGFVAYKIKPAEDIQIGDMITGTASIFFDYNLPIITNSADTEVIEFLGVNNYELNTVSVYPNPTKGTVHFNALNNTSIEGIKIYNLQGSEIMAFEGYQESIDVQNLSTGIYLLNIQTDKGISRHRLIKE